MRLLAAGLAVLATAVPASASLDSATDSIRAARGAVRAQLTFQRRGGEYHEARLRITRAGAKRLDEPVAGLGAAGERPVELLVRDLDADGEPEVVLDLYTGGAHCCTESRIYRYAPGPGTYRRSLQGWGNAGYRSKDLDRDGRPELQSADDRFSYLFTSYAGSFRPIRIWHFERGRLLDVTRSFPGAVADDAAAQWREYKRLRAQRRDVRGVLAAWLADMVVLGREGEAWRQLERAYARRELGPRKELAGWPQGRAYLRSLRARLGRLGYPADRRTTQSRQSGARLGFVQGGTAYVAGLDGSGADAVLRRRVVGLAFDSSRTLYLTRAASGAPLCEL